MDRLSVSLALVLGAAVPALAQTDSLDSPPALLLHGNYCGPGNKAPRPPIDALDAACARHDACTPSGGLPARACNLRLQDDAERVSRDPRQPDDLRALAGLVAAGAGLLPADTRLAAAPAGATSVLPERAHPGDPAITDPDLADRDLADRDPD